MKQVSFTKTGRRPTGRVKRIGRFAPALALAIMLAGCGQYFYKAQIAGYVKDAESGAGINGALVRVYTIDPETEADAEGFIVETPTATSGGNAGYFSSSVIWQNRSGQFGKEGDSTELFLGVTHDDYQPAVVRVRGILSDDLNLVPDVRLDRASFTSPRLSGRVIDLTGEGVNGVRLVLDLDSTESETDYITTSDTIDGVAGRYRFTNVRWRNDDPETPSSDSETATVRVDDPTYEWRENDDDARLAVTLVSDENSVAPDDITVTRKPRTEFTATVVGRVYREVNETRFGVQGVTVTLTFDDDDHDDPAEPKTYVTNTNANGQYTFSVRWVDAGPGGSGVPDGEDEQDIVLITFGGWAGTITEIGPTDFKLRSWLAPNYAPDREPATEEP